MNKIRKISVIAACLALLAAAIPLIARAHSGGEPVVVREPVGDFKVSLWALPSPLLPGEANLIVFLTTNEDGQVDETVLNADIQIRLVHERSGQTIETTATHENATNNLFYESYFDLPVAGIWDGEITVTKDGSSGSAPFVLNVEPPEGEINWLLIGGVAVAVIGGLWFAWVSRRPR